MSQDEYGKNSESASGSADRTQPAPVSLGENVENLLADLLGVLLRWARTVALFSVRPAKGAQTACLQTPDYGQVLRPFTFLFVGCLLYSFVLGAIGYATSSRFAEFVVQIAMEIGSDFSFTSLLVRSLPLVIVTSLFAMIAGTWIRTGGEFVRTLLVYLYGLQGTLLLLFVLAIPPLSDALLAWLGSDDYLLLLFSLLVVALGVQGYRALRQVISAIQIRPKVKLLLSFAFPLFFLMPLPLAGYIVVWTGLIPNEVELEARETRIAPIRIIEAKPATIESARAYVVLTALVQNQLKFPFLLTRHGVDIELYFVSGFNSVIFSGQRDKRAVPDVDSFNRYRLLPKTVRAEVRASNGDLSFLPPGGAAVIETEIDVDGSSARFERRHGWDGKHQPIRPKIQRSDKSWNELAEGHSLLVRLTLSDPTSGQSLRSQYFRVETGGDDPR